MGFPDLSIPLPVDADDSELARLCEENTQRLFDWIEKIAKQEPSQTRTRYDGTMKAACMIYQEHPLSTFHTVKHSTQRGYLADLKVILESVGRRVIKNVTVLDVKNWYTQWRKGIVFVDENGNQTVGPERVARAHNAVAMVRMVLRFMAALRHADCKLLAGELANVQFEREGAREQELTYQHVKSFIQAAFKLAEQRVITSERALYMSIGTTSQFELMLRQMDIIGEWTPRTADRRFPTGMSVLHLDDETWSGFYTWEAVPGWRWRTRTSKSKYRSAAEFDLSIYDLLIPLLEMVPMDQRQGPIVKGEHGLPIRYRSYVKWWRQIARAAKIPDDVQSMDARAGGATEAEEAGAVLEGIQANLTHTKKEMSLRYIRRRTKKIAAVAEVRKLSRPTSGNDGTT